MRIALVDHYLLVGLLRISLQGDIKRRGPWQDVGGVVAVLSFMVEGAVDWVVPGWLLEV